MSAPPVLCAQRACLSASCAPGSLTKYSLIYVVPLGPQSSVSVWGCRKRSDLLISSHLNKNHLLAASHDGDLALAMDMHQFEQLLFLFVYFFQFYVPQIQPDLLRSRFPALISKLRFTSGSYHKPLSFKTLFLFLSAPAHLLELIK